LGFLTINLNFTGRPALLVGAGAVGKRKLAALLEAGAAVTVVEPKPDPAVSEMAQSGLIRLVPEFSDSLLESGPVVFVATDDSELSRQIARAAGAQGLLLNVADCPRECNFLMPAIVDLSPLRLAVTTEGASPALAAHLAADFRVRYLGHGLLAKLLGRLRPLILEADLDPNIRSGIFKALAANGQLPELLLANRLAEATEIVGLLIEPVKLPGDFSLV
jgi:siroheme synthase-like protein